MTSEEHGTRKENTVSSVAATATRDVAASGETRSESAGNGRSLPTSAAPEATESATAHSTSSDSESNSVVPASTMENAVKCDDPLTEKLPTNTTIDTSAKWDEDPGAAVAGPLKTNQEEALEDIGRGQLWARTSEEVRMKDSPLKNDGEETKEMSLIQSRNTQEGEDACGCSDDVRIDFEVTMPLPMPRLARGINRAQTSLPGAFPVGGSGPRAEVGVSNEEQASIFEGIENEFSAHLCNLVNDDDDNDEQVLCHDESPTSSTTSNTIEVFDGQIVVDKDTSLPPTNKWLGSILGLTICFVLAVVLPIYLTRKSSNNKGLRPATSKTNSTESIKPQLNPPFQDDLPLAVLGPIQKHGGPFWKAIQWLLDDPNFHAYSRERQRQRFYLALIYYATNGDTTWIQNDHWLSYNVSECQWFSSTSFDVDSKYYLDHVCDENNTVINLSLSNNNLTGSLPIYYTDFLPVLKVFDIGGNYIGGSFPVIISTPYIEIFIISKNFFGGSFFYDAGVYFANVKVIRIDWTTPEGNYQGALPYLVPKLEVFNLTGQYSDGEIWSSVGLLTNLEYLSYAHRCDVSGSIPRAGKPDSPQGAQLGPQSQVCWNYSFRTGTANPVNKDGYH
jgi:hypothetical protein